MEGVEPVTWSPTPLLQVVPPVIGCPLLIILQHLIGFSHLMRGGGGGRGCGLAGLGKCEAVRTGDSMTGSFSSILSSSLASAT